MEKLSLSDAPPHGGQAVAPLQVRGAPQPPPQLPPQMFTTAAQLLDFTDKKLMIVLRDGRKLIGVLRSWDQFANLVLQSTTERIFATKTIGADPHETTQGLYADVFHGIFLVRGENVLMLGEIDLDKDDDAPAGYEVAELEVVKKLAEERKSVEKTKEKTRLKKLAKIGFEGENLGEIAL
ncbi:LSM domain-containing protein [Hirsutella rhossiliensis]|uniref:U6 snRNA-associated Sm-like protein LSm1 n=1 Tax=Hirsutella rhossiliensis TaxID=111463 RepID=A0A9P8MSZ2_9HYPO|nr:LSM domain-containing protein [Hirsutella rhossiliensis]KAH0960730.1 LSM domain-containing protein [Hirsutella rhossiliensis]